MSEQEIYPVNDERIREMARALRESKIGLLQKLAALIGMDQMEVLFRRTLEIQAAGGMPTSDGQQRRTPGGVLFQLTKEVLPSNVRRKTFREKRRKPADATSPAPKTPKPPPIEPQPPTTEQVAALLQAAAAVPADKKGPATVKTTIIGRPKQIKKMDTCVLLVLAPKPPGTLPKGLPPVPDQANATIAIFVATKQWDKVEEALKQDPTDEIIVEGFPANDPKNQITAVWAQSCTTKMLQRAKREAQSAGE